MTKFKKSDSAFSKIKKKVSQKNDLLFSIVDHSNFNNSNYSYSQPEKNEIFSLLKNKNFKNTENLKDFVHQKYSLYNPT